MSPKFSDSRLPRRVPASMPINHSRQAPLAARQVPGLILTWHWVLLGAETSDLFVLPARSQHAPRWAHIQAAAQEPPATEGSSNWSWATSSAWPRYQGNFSIFLPSPPTWPLADAHKGLFMGSIAHHLLLHCIFYASIPQSIFTDKCHCLPLTDGPERKAQRVKWFNEGHSKSQSRGGNWTQSSLLPGLSPATPGPRWEQPASKRALPTLPVAACHLPIFATKVQNWNPVFLTRTAQIFGWKGPSYKIRWRPMDLPRPSRMGGGPESPLRRWDAGVRLKKQLRYLCG